MIPVLPRSRTPLPEREDTLASRRQGRGGDPLASGFEVRRSDRVSGEVQRGEAGVAPECLPEAGGPLVPDLQVVRQVQLEQTATSLVKLQASRQGLGPGVADAVVAEVEVGELRQGPLGQTVREGL